MNVINDIKYLKDFLNRVYDDYSYDDYITDFRHAEKVYMFTNENLTESFPKNLENKKVLCVTSSGDHLLNAVLAGATDITCFDINIFCKYYARLKIAMIKASSYNNYERLFKFMTKPLFYMNDNGLKLFNSILINDLAKYLTSEDLIFWKTYYRLYKYNQNCDKKLLTYDALNFEDCYYNNRYLEKEEFYKLKSKLDKANINYITSYIINLKYKLNGKFDYINLSNILERINNNKKEVSKKILQDLYKYLKKNGCISCYNFKISVNDIPLEILDIYETEFDTYVGLYLNKDVVALYKKKQKK